MKPTLLFLFAVDIVLSAQASPPAGRAGEAALSGRSVYQVGGRWTDDLGRAVDLSEFRGRPVVIAMFFTRCGYACPMTVGEMQRIREALSPAARERTAFVLVSFDSDGDRPAALREYRDKYRLDPAGWSLLNGAADDVRGLAMVLGVQYAQTPAGLFSHSSLITVLDSEGQIAFQAAPADSGTTAGALAAVGR